MLTMDQGRIIYRERPLPLALRGFSAVLGLGVGLGIPVPWLANVRADTSLPVLVLVALVVMASLTMGAFLLVLSRVSATELQIDPTRPDALRIRRDPIVNDQTLFPRRDFGRPEVIMRASEDGDFPVLRLPRPRGRPIEMACFSSRAEAEGWRDTIGAALRA